MLKNKKFLRFIYLISIILILELSLYFALKKTSPKYTNDVSYFSTALASSCKESSDWQKCYGNNLKEITKKRGIEFALKVRRETEKIDARTSKCHLIAHYVALSNVELNPTGAYDLFKYVNLTDCAYGFVHGTIEGLNRYDSTFEVSNKSIPEICKKISEANNFSYIDQGCLHSMGHLVLADNCNKDIEEGIRQATGTCSKLSQELRNECYAGIFMESFTRDNLNLHCNMPYISLNEQAAKNQEKICLSYSGEKASACWQEISHIYLTIQPFNPGEGFARCSRAPKKEDAANCYIHIAAMFAWKDNLVGKYTLPTLCSMFNEEPEFMSNCFKTAVKGLLYTSLEYIPRAKTICIGATGVYKEKCFDIIVETLSAKTKLTKNPNVCSEFPDPYKTRCQNAIN